MISILSRRTRIIVIAAVVLGALAILYRLDSPPGPRIDEEALARASGVALVRVASIKRVDLNICPGGVADNIGLEVIKSSGVVRESLSIIVWQEDGPMPPPRPDAPPPPPPVRRPIEPGDLVVGRRYWLVFGFDHPGSWQKANVIAWQNAGAFGDYFSRPARAVRDDRFRWWRMFVPATGLTLEHLVESDGASWTVRVVRQGDILWSKTLSGVPTEHTFNPSKRFAGPADRAYNPSMRLAGGGGWPLEMFSEALPADLPVLCASSRGKFPADAEAGLPAGEYLVQHVFDARNGRPLARKVSTVSRVVNIREYDQATGRLVQLTIHQRRETGGRDVGAEDDRWFRHEVRRFDPRTGDHIDTKIYRQDAGHYMNEWVQIAE